MLIKLAGEQHGTTRSPSNKKRVNLCCTVNRTCEQKRPPSEKSGWRYLGNKEKEPLVSKTNGFSRGFQMLQN